MSSQRVANTFSRGSAISNNPSISGGTDLLRTKLVVCFHFGLCVIWFVSLIEYDIERYFPRIVSWLMTFM